MALKMLSRRWLINYLLIALIGIFIYAGNRYQAGSGFPPVNSISSLKPQDIHRVIIQTADNNRFVLGNSSNQWRFENPVQWPADNTTLERIISIVKSNPDARLPADTIDLATFGLQKPRATLTLNDTPVDFGTTNNIGGRRYVKIASTVYLLPDIHLHFITQGINGLIDRRLLPRSVALEALELGKLSLRKKSDGAWQGNAVGEDETTRLNRLANNWQTRNAGSIKIFDRSKAMIEKIVATLENGSKIDFLLMAITPEIVIARPDLGVQYHFAENQYYDLLSIANQNP
jgi:hypothetical protein